MLHTDFTPPKNPAVPTVTTNKDKLDKILEADDITVTCYQTFMNQLI